MHLDQAFTFGQDCYNQELLNPSKHPKISKKSPFYQIVKPTTIKDNSIPKLAQTLSKNQNKENVFCQPQMVIQQKHKRNPTDLNLQRFETSPNSQIEISNNSRGNNSKNDGNRKLSFNTPNQTIKNFLPPVNNTEKYKKIAYAMKELIQKQKQFYEQGNQEEFEKVFEELDQICFQL